MFDKYRKLIATGGLILGLLVCIAGVVTVSSYKKSTECFKDRPPLKSFVLTIERSQQKLLIEQARKFADKHGFDFGIEYFTLDHEDFVIDLTRKDIEVTTLNTGVDLDTYYIGFYNYDCIHPTVASDIQGLVGDLKSFISEIPSAKITEEK